MIFLLKDVFLHSFVNRQVYVCDPQCFFETLFLFKFARKYNFIYEVAQKILSSLVL